MRGLIAWVTLPCRVSQEQGLSGTFSYTSGKSTVLCPQFGSARKKNNMFLASFNILIFFFFSKQYKYKKSITNCILLYNYYAFSKSIVQAWTLKTAIVFMLIKKSSLISREKHYSFCVLPCKINFIQNLQFWDLRSVLAWMVAIIFSRK